MLKKAILTTLCVFNFCFAMEESEPIFSRPLTFKRLQKGDNVEPCIPVSEAAMLSLYDITPKLAKQVATEYLTQLSAKLDDPTFTFLCGYDAQADDRLAALVAFQPDGGDDTTKVCIDMLSVLPEYQNLDTLRLLAIKKALQYFPDTTKIIAQPKYSKTLDDWMIKIGFKALNNDEDDVIYIYSVLKSRGCFTQLQ